MTRSDRIVVLTWSLLDALRQPRTSMSTEERKESGFAWQLCGACDGEGQTQDRFGRPMPCLTCEGRGRYEIDAYTERRVSTAASPAGEPRVELVGCAWCQPSHGQEARGKWDSLPRGTGVRLGARCDHCDGTGWRTLTLAAGDDTARSRSRGELVAWTMHGDWPALFAALTRLRTHDRAAHLAFMTEALQGRVRSERAIRGLAFLARRMPSRIVVPAGVIAAWEVRDHRAREAERKRQARLGAEARRARNEAIRHARRAGVPATVVAREFGVSERTARRIA